MTKPTGGAPRRQKRQKQRFTKKSVLKMLAVMSGNENGEDPVKDFLSTGRVGRRNALPNILSEHALTTTADLPDKLMSLSTKEGEGDQEACMSTDDPKDDIGNEASGTSS